MRTPILATGLAVLTALTGTSTPLAAGDKDKKGTEVEFIGMKATVPADWKREPVGAGPTAPVVFKLPRVAGDPEDAELSLYPLRPSVSIESELVRTGLRFELPGGTNLYTAGTMDRINVGPYQATSQDLQGTYLKVKPNGDGTTTVTKLPDHRQLFVAFKTKDGLGLAVLVGPAKTVEKHKKAFDSWLRQLR